MRTVQIKCDGCGTQRVGQYQDAPDGWVTLKLSLDRHQLYVGLVTGPVPPIERVIDACSLKCAAVAGRRTLTIMATTAGKRRK